MTININQIAAVVQQIPTVMAWVAMLVVAVAVLHMTYSMITSRQWTLDPMMIIALAAFYYALK